MEARLRVRASSNDAHYAGDLVDGAWVLGLFGDLATEISILHDGDEGLFRAYEEIEFLAPVVAGDFVEARATLVSAGRTSRKIEFVAEKQVCADPERSVTAGRLIDPPLPIARASGTVVVPEQRQSGGSVSIHAGDSK
ncbi:MAG: 3-aminobutyryl-CoA ammonia lyase [Solirubrobacterales bacterium 67-14]|nr:MAG: 3-aminobutyryl-CoA ammonia lyase [Solirubrobacterales bacterium 67-14]